MKPIDDRFCSPSCIFLVSFCFLSSPIPRPEAFRSPELVPGRRMVAALPDIFRLVDGYVGCGYTRGRFEKLAISGALDISEACRRCWVRAAATAAAFNDAWAAWYWTPF